MLWSLLRVLLFVVLIGAATYGIGLLIDAEAGLRLTFAAREYHLGPLQAAIAVVALVVGLWLAIKLLGLLVAVLRFINGDETAITRYLNRRNERRGFEALADSLLALASGEGRDAMAKAARANRFLRRPELTNLLTAQAAELAGDKRKAESVYRELLSDQRTRFVGVRGLMRQKLQEGDTHTAMKLAEKAFAIKPRHEETQDLLLSLQAEKEDWGGARKTLKAKAASGALPRDVHRRRDAVLALSEAREEDSADAAIEANRLSPQLVPAAVLAARHYIVQGKARYATRVIKKAWETTPHPDLAAVFAEIAPDESPAARLKRFAPLLRAHQGKPEAQMLEAELHIAAQDYAAARTALGDLPQTHPTTRSLTLMAAIERAEGASEAEVRGWLTKALSADRGPQWVCDKCHSVHVDWWPVCRNCSSFDTLTWTNPPEGTTTGAAEMLPLFVEPEEPEAEDADDAEVIDTSPPEFIATEDESPATDYEIGKDEAERPETEDQAPPRPNA